jgi:hypothetical protein
VIELPQGNRISSLRKRSRGFSVPPNNKADPVPCASGPLLIAGGPKYSHRLVLLAKLPVL